MLCFFFVLSLVIGVGVVLIVDVMFDVNVVIGTRDVLGVWC